MVASDEVIRRLEHLRDHPLECIQRFKIEDERNHVRELSPLWFEQQTWAEALISKQFVFGLKPRQVGFTTVTCAFLMWKALFSLHGRRILNMVHEEDAKVRMAQMVRVYHDNLPVQIRPGYEVNSQDRTQFRKYGRNGVAVPGSSFNRLLAGGRGQARSWTYNDLHATEMAKWPSGSSASRSQEGRSVDEEAFSSAMNTIHDPTASVIVESTGNGPRGLFFDLYQQATTDPAWAFVFVKWTDVPRYRIPLTDPDRRALEADLDASETRLVKTYGLDLEQIAWRRGKLRSLRMTELTFRREFPLTDMEPFLLDEHGWFDQEALLSLLQYVPALGASDASIRFFHPYEKDRKYSIGMDTCGGVGRDEACIQVVRDDLLNVATWASNRAAPPEQALMLSRISNAYGRPPCVVEANNHGQDVIARAAGLGVNLWKDEHGQDFWSTGGRAGNSKRLAMVHIRDIVDHEWSIINDAATIRQAQKVVEKPTGQIEATAGHDDRIYAYALALWGARRFWAATQSGTLDTERDRVRRIQQRVSMGSLGWK